MRWAAPRAEGAMVAMQLPATPVTHTYHYEPVAPYMPIPIVTRKEHVALPTDDNAPASQRDNVFPGDERVEDLLRLPKPTSKLRPVTRDSEKSLLEYLDDF